VNPYPLFLILTLECPPQQASCVCERRQKQVFLLKKKRVRHTLAKWVPAVSALCASCLWLFISPITVLFEHEMDPTCLV